MEKKNIQIYFNFALMRQIIWNCRTHFFHDVSGMDSIPMSALCRVDTGASIVLKSLSITDDS